MNEQQLQEVYQMVDNIPLSRSKKNISRDFSDGLLMAEVIHFFNPKIVQLHNYPASNALKKKMQNWQTLNRKVLKKIGIFLSPKDIQNVANSYPNAIEQILYQILVRFQKPDEQVKLSTNARKIQKSAAESRRNMQQQHLLLKIDNKDSAMEINNSSFNNSMQDNYNTELKMQKEEEEINEISNKIEQSYAQLLKLTELNKVKQDMIINLEKKLEKIMFS